MPQKMAAIGRYHNLANWMEEMRGRKRILLRSRDRGSLASVELGNRNTNSAKREIEKLLNVYDKH